MRKKKLPYLVRNMEVILILILFTMIGGYFSIAEERIINQVFKTIARIGMAGVCFLIYVKLRSLGMVVSFRYDNILAPVFYILYLFLGFASFLWSTDVQYSALQWFMTFESFVFVLLFMWNVAVYNRYFPQKRINFIKMMAWAVFPIMLTFVIGSFVEPDTFYRGMRGGEEQRLGGWIMNPNELGMLSSIAAAMSYLYLIQSTKKFWGIFMMLAAIIVLVLTSSRSSAIGFLLIMGVLILKSKNKKLKIAMAAGAILAVPLLIRFVVFKDDGGVEEVLSMTGRLPFWTALLNEGIVREPFLGFGFMRINYTDSFAGLNTYAGHMTHNTFLQALMNLGFIGLTIALWNVILTVRNFVRNMNDQYANFFIALFIPTIINSFTEFGIFGDANYGILFWQFLVLLFVVNTHKTDSFLNRIKMKSFRKNYGLEINPS